MITNRYFLGVDIVYYQSSGIDATARLHKMALKLTMEDDRIKKWGYQVKNILTLFFVKWTGKMRNGLER